MDDKRAAQRQLKEQKKANKLAKLQHKLARLQVETQAKTKEQKIRTKTANGSGYDPKQIEEYWIEYWKTHQVFKPHKSANYNNIFTMCIPPPNITGSLHIGHAMMIAIEDSIARYKRLNGFEVLYLPGLDHAGIATQNVVIKQLQKQFGNEFKADRKTFLESAQEWATKYGNRIFEQFDRLGCSVDYSRKVFTMDEKRCQSVTHAFVELYKRGLIYRENKLVNWSGKLKTTISDLEVNYKEIEGGTYLEVDGGRYKFGMMYYVKYELTEKEEGTGSGVFIKIGTTRPETILGDCGICVNPDDERFTEMIRKGMNKTSGEIIGDETNQTNNVTGTARSTSHDKHNMDAELRAERKNKYKNKIRGNEERARRAGIFAINPLTGKRIPVLYDDAAQLGFGTGILKVTPAHDPADYQIGKRHHLESITVFDDENRIQIDGPYLGLSRFEARKRIVSDLRLSGMLVGEEPYDQIIPICSRSGDIVEPRLKEQWWLKCADMAQRAADAVRNGEIQLIPNESHPVWFRWLDNIKDWCLSRQLWWGHRIPAYLAYRSDGSTEWFVSKSAEEAHRTALAAGFDRIEQDGDVLDTWFSSGLWPFSTLGWPERSDDFVRYFPTSLLETGSDILFFWVARMVMLSYELCGLPPFRTILLHGIVRDSHGRKMSKSLGNVVDPLHVIEGISLTEMITNLKNGNLDHREVSRATDALKKDFPSGIPKCGADALRFTLLSYMNGAKDINLDILRVRGYSRLCNKIYNAYKFVSSLILNDQTVHSGDKLIRNIGDKPHCRWILNKLNICITEMHTYFDEYNFMMATRSIHSFFIYDFCDVFIEFIKGDNSDENTRIAMLVMADSLALFNPFMPFITEELHFRLTGKRIEMYPKCYEQVGSSSFGDVVLLAKTCRGKNIKILKKDNKIANGLKMLTRASIEIVDELNEYQECGAIKYTIIN